VVVSEQLALIRGIAIFCCTCNIPNVAVPVNIRMWKSCYVAALNREIADEPKSVV
jgi:hypothetical protein